MTEIPSDTVTVRRASTGEVLPLRHSVLRPNQTLEQCRFAGDEDPLTMHFVAERNGDIVGIGSVYEEQSGVTGDGPAWRLRGMATGESARGTGAGRALLEAAMGQVRAQGGALFWCNARVPARGFYTRMGFEAVGEEFELPGIGPHVYMHRRIVE